MQSKGASGVSTHIYKEDPSQYWQAEYNGDSAGKLAFKNIGNGEYLYGSGPGAGARIQTRGQPQWWIPSQGYTKDAYFFKCDDYPDAWLVNRDGNHREGSRTDCWPFQDVWKHALSWYLKPAPDFTPKGWAGNVPQSQSEKEKDQSSQKETELAKREQEVAEQQNTQKTFADQLAAQEKRLAEREHELAVKEAEQKQLADQLAAREKQPSKQEQTDKPNSDKEQSLADREAELERKERDFAGREAELEQKERDFAGREAIAAKESNQATTDVDVSSDLQQMKAEISSLRDQMKALKQSNKKLAFAEPPRSKEQDSATLQEENARLKDLIAHQALQSLDEQKKIASKPTQGGSTGSKAPTVLDKEFAEIHEHKHMQDSELKRRMDEATKNQQKLLGAQPNGKKTVSRSPKATDAMIDHDGLRTVVFDCGHVLHAPPRKIRKKMVGILYA